MMGALRQTFFENPLVGRQWATQLTGGRLGAIYFLATGVLLAADAITLGSILVDAPLLGLEGFAGGMLHFVNACVIYGLLILLLPIRLAGALDGPRLDRSFDQLVVTGLSPLRIHFGNWALGFCFALSLLLVSLPFQVYAYMLGGVPLGDLITGYLCLAGVANVIIVTALGMSVVEREWVAAPVTIAIFGLAGALCCVLPRVFGSLAPLRSFLPPDIATGFYRGAPGIILAEPILFTATIPAGVYTVILWLLVMVPSVVWLCLGPSHRFVPGLNNFGNVVLPGDRRRKFLRRFRFALVRKVEVAFFYENRPRWLAGWDFPLRAAVGVGLIVFIWAAIIGLCFDGAPSVHSSLDFNKDLPFGMALGLTAALLFIGLLWCADPRPRLTAKVRIGRREWPRPAAMSLIAGLLMIGFVAMHASLLYLAEPNAAGGPSGAWERYRADWWSFVAGLVLFLLNCHLLGKVLGHAIAAAGALRFLVLLAAGAGLLAPLFIAGCIVEHWLPRDLYPVIFASPIIHYADFQSSMRREIFPQGFRLEDHLVYNVVIQAALAVALSLLLFLISALKRWRQAGLKAASAAALALAGAAWCSLPAQDVENPPGIAVLPLQVEIIHGFEGTLHQQEVDFYTLLLRNAGTETIEGRLWIDHGHSQTPPRPFVAPAGTATALRWIEESDQAIYWSGVLVLEARAGQLRLSLPPPSFKGQSNRNGLAADFLIVEDKGKWDGASSGFGEWTRTRALCLPEDPRAYAGLAAVLVGPADLSRWSAGQRRALHDYVRFGGSLIFYGGIDRGGLQGAGEWAELLATRAGASSPGRAELVVEDLEDGRTLIWHDGESGKSAVPLLNARPVGFGWVGHASCPPSDAVVGQTMMQELIDGLPRSMYPVSLGSSQELLFELRDASSIFAVVGYFALYVLAMGPVLIFGFRKKGRRRVLPLVILLVPLAFVLCLPILYASLHIRPSNGALTRVTCFGAGARRGTAFAWLDIVSTGRQKHTIELTGQGLSVYHWMDSSQRRYGYYPGASNRTFLRPATLRGDAASAATLDVVSMPWGTRRVVIAGDAQLEEPIFGRALYDGRARRLSLQASGLEAFGAASEGRVIVRLPGGETLHVAKVPAASLAGGSLTLDLTLDPPSTPGKKASRSPQLRAGRPIIEEDWPTLILPQRAYVYVGLLVDGGAPAIRTSDIAFERALPEAPEAGDAALAAKRRLLERDGRSFVPYQRTLILQELPLEVR